MEIVGQEKLLNSINKTITNNTFPHTSMIIGPSGSGKHLICNYIKEKLGYDMVDITSILSQELIENIMLKVEPKIYLIDANVITVKQENVILKFIEEPLQNAYIILLCNSINLVLPTISGRCFKWNLQPYSKETLKTFTTNEQLLEICNTPGQIKKLESYSLEALIQLADKLFNFVSTNNFANTLTISNKIAFNQETDKYDFQLFSHILLYVIKNKIYIESNQRLTQYYILTNKLVNDSLIKNINHKLLFEHYLSELKRV